jgi:hypothetical protein
VHIGPGAGFAIGTSFLTLLIGLLAGFFSLLLWPFRAVIHWLRFRKIHARAHVRNLIFIGFDGLDINLTRSAGTYLPERAPATVKPPQRISKIFKWCIPI